MLRVFCGESSSCNSLSPRNAQKAQNKQTKMISAWLRVFRGEKLFLQQPFTAECAEGAEQANQNDFRVLRVFRGEKLFLQQPFTKDDAEKWFLRAPRIPR